ncbi:cyclic nucleotide-binding domain-containing protein [Caenispirillum salinarum]|uniref:cyclic nucleotide-binding domain-containing protein n=1 Tax=Caenispirillum salinarum TaxID=859058 RepID=UPI00384DEDE7
MTDTVKEPIKRLLHNHPFFAGMEEPMLEKLAACATTRTYKAGHRVLKEGACADHFTVLLSGCVAVEVATPEHGMKPLQTLHVGDILGWSWLVAPYRWTFSATAREDTDALVFDAPCLRRALEADHELAYHLMPRFVAVMSERLHSARLQMLDLYGPPAGSGERGLS